MGRKGEKEIRWQEDNFDTKHTTLVSWNSISDTVIISDVVDGYDRLLRGNTIVMTSDVFKQIVEAVTGKPVSYFW